MATLTASQLDLVASFFNDRIEQLTTANGSTVFIQRPKAEAEGFTASADDLPDDVIVDDIVEANSAKKLYRVEVGPVEVSINFVPKTMGIEIAVKVKVPIIGPITVGKVKGNLKQGVVLHFNYSTFVNGDVGVKLDDTTVVLYWNLTAFNNTLKDEVKLFTI